MTFDNGFNVPILFIVFNRPIPTKLTFDKIKQIRPKKLFISADGPRANNLNDKKRSNEVKKIVSDINWECEYKFLFQEKNLGCRLNVSNSISWFFENVELGIILEDDCLPNNTFFLFCEEMLNRYKKNINVFQVNGVNWIENYKVGKDYLFTKYPAIWGWATWKDRWQLYDQNLQNLEGYLNSKDKSIHIKNRGELNHHINNFLKAKDIDSWDYIWKFSIFYYRGLCITPKKNLISNIGFGLESTHTINLSSWKSNMQTHEFSINKNDVKVLEIDEHYDSKVSLKFGFRKRNWIYKLLQRFRQYV